MPIFNRIFKGIEKASPF